MGPQRSKTVIVSTKTREVSWHRGTGQIMQGFKGYMKDLVHYTNEIILTIYFRLTNLFCKGPQSKHTVAAFQPCCCKEEAARDNMHVSGCGSFNKTSFTETSQGQSLASTLKFLPYFQVSPRELVQGYLGTLKVHSQQASMYFIH